MSIFVDTNVFVYARDSSRPAKQGAAERWIAQLWKTGTGRLSSQVLSEYYVTVTSKLDPGMARADARADIRDLMAWRPVPVTGELVAEAWEIQDHFRFSYWDSLIVAAARASGSDQLLSEDLQHGQDLGGVVVIDPFRGEPTG